MNSGDCIHLCRFTINDTHNRKKITRTTPEIVLPGNIIQKIWEQPNLQTRIMEHFFNTKARMSKAMEKVAKREITPRGIELITRLNDSNHDRGLTQWSDKLQPKKRGGEKPNFSNYISST